MMSKWEMVRLGDAADFNMGQSPSSEAYNDVGEGMPFFQGKSDFGLIHPTIRMYCTDPKKIANKNDILMSVRAPVGTVNIANEHCCIGRGLAAISPKDNVSNHKYLYRYLQYKENDIASMGVGSTFKAISKKDLDVIEIPLPPLPVQQQIADVLDRASALIEKRKAQIEKLDLLVKSQFIEMFGDPVTNPKGWDIAEIGELASLQGGYAFKSNDYVDNGIKLVQISNVHKDALTWDEVNYVPYGYEKKYHQFLLKNGDIVIAMTRPIIKSLDAVKIAQVSIGDGVCLLNQRVGRFIINSAASTNFFLLEFCKTQYFRNRVEAFSSVSLQPNISSKQIESIACYCPPLTLQNKYAEFVQQVEPQKTLLQQSLAKLEQNYKSLMQKCFRGEVF